MAKSLRSKWKRKMRSLKRQKNAPKELERLKKVLSQSSIKDVVMSEEHCQLKTVPVSGKISKVEDEAQDDSAKMDIENKRNKKTMADENGQYPVWMNGRKIKKIKQRKKGKVGRQKRLAW